MSDAILAHEPWLRAAAFFGVLAVMASWEGAAPRRRSETSRSRRWPVNLGLLLVDVAALRLLLPAAAVGAALFAEARGWGLLYAVALPSAAAVVMAVVVLDLAVYAQHVASHKLGWLWRLHRVHHTDIAFDVTTAVRFHPAEILLSMLYKMAVVVALGAPAAAVVLFEIVLNASSLFNHGNVRLPAAVDRVLRLVIVTPDMHRVHHSVHRDETDSNYGFNLALWDRLFATYRAQPRDGHTAMRIGLREFRDPTALGLWPLLIQPLARR